LVTAFIIIGLSWVFYHESTDVLPYVGFRQSWLRFCFDSVIAFSYIFLILNVNSYSTFSIVVFVIYLLYGLHGFATVLECGWFRGWPLKPNSTPNLWLVFSLGFLGIGYASSYFIDSLGNDIGGFLTLLLVLFGVVLSRFLRHSHKARGPIQNFAERTSLQPRPIVALDVDGVLAEQVPHVLTRAEREMGVKMEKEQITEWDTPVGGIPFDKLIASYLLDPKFVISMPVAEGAALAVKTLRTKCEVIVASSRPRETEADTIKWLTDNFGIPSESFTNTTGTRKYVVNADILIDDYIPNLRSFIDGGKHRIGVLFSQPWNSQKGQHDEIDELEKKGVIVVKNSWKEIESIF
jgi:5'(3')-deoxyribonucleotidase